MPKVRNEVEERIKAKVWEMRVKRSTMTNATPAKPTRKMPNDTFIQKHSAELTNEDIELLQKPKRTTKEVAAYLEVHPNQVAKWVKEGQRGSVQDRAPGQPT